MITAKQYWQQKFGEDPQTDADKLACAMMAEYAANYQYEAEALAKQGFQPQRDQLLIDQLPASEEGYSTPIERAGKEMTGQDWEQYCG